MSELYPSPCPRAGRWFGGCRFEARHDLKDPHEMGKVTLEGRNVAAMRLALKDRVYVHDICIRCGKVVAR